MTPLETRIPGPFLLRVATASLLLFVGLASGLRAAPWDPAAADYTGRKGTTLYVSKLGDNSSGSTWPKAFRTIQAALDAVPDDQGGHQIVVRPDTYVEANLAPSHKGALGAYNALIGDFDGGLGSDAKGWVLIDSGDPEKGFKSWGWWSTFRASDKHWQGGNNKETFSSIVWDRWFLRNLYLADVWLNDVHVGRHEGGETPFVFDVTEAIKPNAANRLAVRMLDPSNEPIDGIVLSQTAHRCKVVPYRAGAGFNHGGIVDSVELLLVPPVRVDDLFVRPDVDQGKIRVQVKVRNAAEHEATAQLELTVAPAASGETLQHTVLERNLPPGDTLVETELCVDQPQRWELNAPNLYRVTARVSTHREGEAPARRELRPPRSSARAASFDERSVRVANWLCLRVLRRLSETFGY